MDAYEEVFSRSSSKHAPWFVIPSDHKWYRNVAISGLLTEVMKDLKLEFPKPTFDPKGLKLDDESEKSAAKKVHKRVNEDTVDVNADSEASGKH